MRAKAFWKTVTADRSDFLERTLALFEAHDIRFCLIGGQAVNAYADPVVSLDLDIVVAVDQVQQAESLLSREFRVERFPFSLNVSDPGSDLRVQVQTDPRYAEFVERSELRDVLGIRLPVADVTDVLQGKVWAAGDPTRRPSKHLKDLSDIARILEARPDLMDRVPEAIRRQLG
jgi:hypothetical protein